MGTPLPALAQARGGTCMHFLGALGPCEVTHCPPVLEMTPCPRAAEGRRRNPETGNLVPGPQIMPFPLKINTYIDR